MADMGLITEEEGQLETEVDEYYDDIEREKYSTVNYCSCGKRINAWNDTCTYCSISMFNSEPKGAKGN